LRVRFGKRFCSGRGFSGGRKLFGADLLGTCFDGLSGPLDRDVLLVVFRGASFGDEVRETVPVGGEFGVGRGSCRVIRPINPFDPAESDLVVRVTVADRERTP
jgi:hypothetical protein